LAPALGGGKAVAIGAEGERDLKDDRPIGAPGVRERGKAAQAIVLARDDNAVARVLFALEQACRVVGCFWRLL